MVKDCRDLRTRREASVDTENLAVNELFMRKELGQANGKGWDRENENQEKEMFQKD